MPIYPDGDLFIDLGLWLRAQHFDALHTREVRLDGQSDPKQLAFATRQGRVLVTANLRDFRMLREAWLVWGELWDDSGHRPHPGILVVPNQNAKSIEAMATLLDEFARDAVPELIQGRLLRWTSESGREDLSTVR